MSFWVAYLMFCMMAALCVHLAMQWLDARDSGWLSLRRAHAATHKPLGQIFKQVTIELNDRIYNHGATVSLEDEGLFLHLSKLERIAHRPLFIPWARMKVVADGWNTIVQLAATPRPVSLGVTDPIAREIISRIARRSPYWPAEARRVNRATLHSDPRSELPSLAQRPHCASERTR